MVVSDLELLEKHHIAPASGQAPRRGGAHHPRSHHDGVDPVHQPSDHVVLGYDPARREPAQPEG